MFSVDLFLIYLNLCPMLPKKALTLGKVGRKRMKRINSSQGNGLRHGSNVYTVGRSEKPS